MKKNFTCVFFCLFSILGILNAQERYLDEIFTEVTVESDIVYATNATILFLATAGEAIPIPLTMDVYQPVGDTETDRPVVMVFHTGNFLPPIINGQIAGSKTDSSSVEICTQLAKRGFVAASVTYRTGWNPLAETQPVRALGLIQAAFRATQDGKTAVRFLKSTIDAGNPYGITGDKITAWGNGTGGYLTLALAALNDDAEVALNQVLDTSNPALKFWLDGDDDGVPETPMVVPAYHGDIEGKMTTVVPADGFGFTAGDTTNYANHVDYSSDFHLAVNIGGALGDISWLDTDSNPTISVQSPFDIFAPYGDDVLIVPTTNEPVVQVQGSRVVAETQHALGNLDYASETYDDAITATAKANSTVAMHDYYEGLFPFIRPLNSLGIPEGVVLDWWDENAPAPGAGMNIPYNQLPHPSDPTGMTSYHQQGLVINEGMSAEKARANIADIMAYVIPRMYVQLDLEAGVSSVDDLPISELELAVTPNPASELVNISAPSGQIEKVVITDLSGRTVLVNTGSYTELLSIDISTLETGVYIVQAQLENSIATSRLTVE